MGTKATNRSRFTISGVGCCLLDYIYGQVDFGADAFARYRSQVDGDGGLSPGKLTFGEEFAQFAGRDADLAVREITAGKPVDAVNVGGPAVVALIHAARFSTPSASRCALSAPSARTTKASCCDSSWRARP